MDSEGADGGEGDSDRANGSCESRSVLSLSCVLSCSLPPSETELHSPSFSAHCPRACCWSPSRSCSWRAGPAGSIFILNSGTMGAGSDVFDTRDVGGFASRADEERVLNVQGADTSGLSVAESRVCCASSSCPLSLPRRIGSVGDTQPSSPSAISGLKLQP